MVVEGRVGRRRRLGLVAVVPLRGRRRLLPQQIEGRHAELLPPLARGVAVAVFFGVWVVDRGGG